MILCRIDIAGSGSDFAPFVQLAGVPICDITYDFVSINTSCRWLYLIVPSAKVSLDAVKVVVKSEI